MLESYSMYVFGVRRKDIVPVEFFLKDRQNIFVHECRATSQREITSLIDKWHEQGQWQKEEMPYFECKVGHQPWLLHTIGVAHTGVAMEDLCCALDAAIDLLNDDCYVVPYFINHVVDRVNVKAVLKQHGLSWIGNKLVSNHQRTKYFTKSELKKRSYDRKMWSYDDYLPGGGEIKTGPTAEQVKPR